MAKLLLLAGLSAVGLANLSQEPIAPEFPATLNSEWDHDSCTISKSAAFEMHHGSNQFSTSPTEHMDSAKITPTINATNWEQWEFDGISDTGLSSILMGFSRDHSFHMFGQGNLRVEFYITLGDGTIIQELDYVAESTIIDCPDFITGIFNSTKKSYSFHVTKDLKHAMLNFNSTRIQGTVKMSSTVPPHFADGSPWGSEDVKSDSASLAPGLFYSLPMAGASVEIDAKLSSGKKIAFTGSGGHARLWAVDSWLNIADGWHAVRARAGPYTIAYWEIDSRTNRGTKYHSGQLFFEGKVVAASRIGSVSSDDYLLFSDMFGGEVSGRLTDKNTGHILEFVSPDRDRRWKFTMQHILKQYEMGVGSGFGLTGFANRIVGGEVGGLQYEGKGVSEQTFWPEYIATWKIWVVYGIGFLGDGKHYLMQVAGYLF